MIKKLLIGASALALSAGAAHAQVTANPPLGILADATSPANNDSNVVQNQNNNYADINQVGGSNNKSEVRQGLNGIANTGDNHATVKQSSANGSTAGNTALVKQVGTERNNILNHPAAKPSDIPAGYRQSVAITQKSTGAKANQAEVTQGADAVLGNLPIAGGLFNRATVDQDGSGNKAQIVQGGVSGVGAGQREEDGRMIASISQTGKDNLAQTRQGEIDRSSTVQVGDGNIAYVDQPAQAINGSDTLNRESAVSQYGNTNAAYVLQTANDTKSTINQGAANATANSNNAFVTQSGLGAQSTVTQKTDSNTANVNQSGAKDGAFAATSNVTQYGGTLNNASVTQSKNANSDVDQNGNRNTATVNQSGSRADSDVDQKGDRNVASIVQGGNFADSNLLQDGDRNEADVNQSGNDTTSDIKQDGGRNYSLVRQAGVNADSDIDQIGNYQYADVRQGAVDAESVVYQSGDGNGLLGAHRAIVRQDAGATGARSEVTQTGSSGSFGGSTALVSQESGAVNTLSQVKQAGVGHLATVIQSGAGVAGGATPAESFIEQVGSVNVATLIQRADQATSLIKQGFVRTGVNAYTPTTSSRGNVATVSQTSTATGAASDIAQSGRTNLSLVIQTGAGAASTIDQVGEDNLADVFQADDATSTVKQNGDLHDAYVTQNVGALNADSSIIQKGGDRNYASVTQSAELADSDIIQTGNRNRAIVTQTGAGKRADSEITQTGDRNLSTVTQTVADVESIISQVGNLNTATVLQTVNAFSYSNISQNGSNNIANVQQ